eukprot:scaffold34582_cov28-Tisochrysis_lutea.AAC.5
MLEDEHHIAALANGSAYEPLTRLVHKRRHDCLRALLRAPSTGTSSCTSCWAGCPSCGGGRVRSSCRGCAEAEEPSRCGSRTMACCRRWCSPGARPATCPRRCAGSPRRARPPPRRCTTP